MKLKRAAMTRALRAWTGSRDPRGYTHPMIVEPNWGAFSAKFNGKEQKAFEWFGSRNCAADELIAELGAAF
ncbi:hypothetical protein ACVME8_009539 [Bradyrhizobium diazoefficiens]